MGSSAGMEFGEDDDYVSPAQLDFEITDLQQTVEDRIARHAATRHIGCIAVLGGVFKLDSGYAGRIRLTSYVAEGHRFVTVQVSAEKRKWLMVVADGLLAPAPNPDNQRLLQRLAERCEDVREIMAVNPFTAEESEQAATAVTNEVGVRGQLRTTE